MGVYIIERSVKDVNSNKVIDMRHFYDLQLRMLSSLILAALLLFSLSSKASNKEQETPYRQMYCEVAVIGGGAGGVGAAIEAARHGKHVVLFEKGVSLGGLATNGYVPQVAGNVEGICLEFAKRMDTLGYLKHQDKQAGEYHSPVFDPEMGKIVLEEMVQRAGARIMYDCTCFKVIMNEDGTRIERALFQTKGGYLSVRADMFIDATGDAIVANMAGVPNEVGGQDFAGLNMSTTMGTRWAGANLEKYMQAEKNHKREQKAQGRKPSSLVYDLESKAIAQGRLVRHICNPIVGFFRVVLPGCEMTNADFVTFSFHSYYCRNTDPEDISRQIIEQHRMMRDFQEFLRADVPGFENVKLIGTGSLPGVRDSRRIFGEYMLTSEDVATGRKFEDGIARFPNMFDTHHPTSDAMVFMRHIHMDAQADHGSGVTEQRKEPAKMHPFFEPDGIQVRVNPRDWCDIPYRCLIPRFVDNLLAVGRCCSTEFHANGAIRIIGPAMSTGQAAGLAAAMSLESGKRPRDIDGKLVRKRLIEEGVALDKAPGGYWKEVREQQGRIVVTPLDAAKVVGQKKR